MRTLDAIAAAGETDAGQQREVNEDRCYVDQARGLFIVIDGVGGQAAGGKAADVALCMLRERLERETGPVAERVREAIAVANNEIHRLASTRPEWDGMACVLTVAVVKDGRATIGHVGDTRLYALRDGGIEKVTRDHSPVGEREDALEISEREAMRHPRRNEVYRDVGSEPHSPDDAGFVELHEIPFEPEHALLLCSDGLSDLVDSTSILRVVSEHAGDPHAVARALIDAANGAGGKDNVTVVYVEGERFAARQSYSRQSASTAILLTNASSTARRWILVSIIAATLAMTGFAAYRAGLIPSPSELSADVRALFRRSQVVAPGQSITAALARARAGSEIVVEPGEYRERITLTNNIRLISRVPRGATIRLPATDPDTRPEPAVSATGSASGALVGFRIVGDAQTPLGVGVHVAGSGVSLVDVEVSGATTAAVSFAAEAAGDLVGSDIHDNAGSALVILRGATPRIANTVFSRNGTSQNTIAAFTVEKGAMPRFQQNVFVGLRPDVLAALKDSAGGTLEHENWFVAPGSAAPQHRAAPGSALDKP
jgi:serine/threonine protein phosphatase PrpC